MEILVILVFMPFILAAFIGILQLVTSSAQEPVYKRGQEAEVEVSHQLRQLDIRSYVLFENLIIPSSGNTSHTEIDHVVVSPYGIFCVETKSHKGLIFGSYDRKYWTQCIGSQKHELYNPLRQNYKHIKALEQLLGANIKAPIHSYVVFPNACKLTVDSENATIDAVEINEKISKHKQQIYNLPQCERILKTLAYASSKSDSLSAAHKQEVASYLNSKSA